MKSLLQISVLLSILVSQARGQWTNNGASIHIGDAAVLYVGGDFEHKSGKIQLKGNLFLNANWLNNAPNEAFDEQSTGEVVLVKGRQIIGGSQKTVFPSLNFVKDSEYDVSADIDVRMQLAINASEIRIADGKRLTLLNTDPNALLRTSGYFNTKTNQSLFVRNVSGQRNYVFPFGNSTINQNSNVIVENKGGSESAYAFAFVGHGSDADGYTTHSVKKPLESIDDRFYYTFNRLSGTGLANISVFTRPIIGFNSLATWQNNAAWENVSNVQVNDNNYLFGQTLSKSFEVKNWNLPLGISVPVVLAKSGSTQMLEFFNAFSPDGDGKNDRWEIPNIDNYPDNELRIFDRSGSMVFQKKSYNSSSFWGAENVSSGTYFYVLNVKINGQEKQFKGSITLVKN